MANIEKLLEIAKEAAYEAGEIHLSFLGKKKNIEHKLNEFDLVTEADKQSEEKIISIIKTNFPDHDILAEETGCHCDNKSGFLWIIDPLDGTTNFAHNFPHFAVSIGLVKNGEIYLGTVYDAFKNELFWAAKGTGAYLNSELIQVSKIQDLSKSLMATGFPYTKSNMLEENFVYFKEFIYKAQAVRRPGAASLDICYTACGRLDGFWEINLSAWDVTAGACIVREAEGIVTNFDSDNFDPYVRNIIASNGLIHDQMKNVISSSRERIK
jgi:myo-inositol-1(or 4)-monophosphatase